MSTNNKTKKLDRRRARGGHRFLKKEEVLFIIFVQMKYNIIIKDSASYILE